MSSPDMVLDVLRAELRAAGITYKMLADRIAMSESSIKRMFGQKDMTLSRLAQICQAAGIALEDVLRRAADARPQADTLTLPQETSLVANPRLLLVAICCLGHWSLEQIIETYRLSEPECIGMLAELDRLGQHADAFRFAQAVGLDDLFQAPVPEAADRHQQQARIGDQRGFLGQ